MKKENDYLYYLYRHIRLDTNKPFYIGVGTVTASKSNSYKARHSRAFLKTKRNNIWEKIVNKTRFRVEIIYTSRSRREILLKEKFFVRLYGRIDQNTGTLSNLTDGGESLSLKAYSPISRFNSKYNNPQRTEITMWKDGEVKQVFLSISDAVKELGKSRTFIEKRINKSYLIEEPELIRSLDRLGNEIDFSSIVKAARFYRMSPSVISKAIRSNCSINLDSRSLQRKVKRNDGKLYNSIKEAAKDSKCSASMLSSHLNGRYKKCKQFTFKFDDNLNLTFLKKEEIKFIAAHTHNRITFTRNI